MQWVETTGRTDAKEAALDQLGIDESEAEFEILEEPKTGLFGRMRNDARVRARVVPKSPRPKQERRGRNPRTAPKDEAPAAESETDASEGSEASETSAEGSRPGGSARRSGSRGRGGRGTGGSNNGDAVADKKEGKQMTDETVSVGEQADIITEFLEGLVVALGAEGTVKRNQIDDDTIELSIEGNDLGLLIGPKGQTLTAVHELARTVLQRRATGRHEGRVRIDIGGYRHRRQEALVRFVQQQATEVIAQGSSRALEAMNAVDRKIVHDAANEIEGVSTISEGVDPQRRVVIVPEGSAE